MSAGADGQQHPGAERSLRSAMSRRSRRVAGLLGLGLVLSPAVAQAQDPVTEPCIAAALDNDARILAMEAAGWTLLTSQADRRQAASEIAAVFNLLVYLTPGPTDAQDQEDLIAEMTDPDQPAMADVLAQGQFFARDQAVAAALATSAGSSGYLHCAVIGPDTPQVIGRDAPPASPATMPADIWFADVEGASGAMLTYIRFDFPYPTDHPLARMQAEVQGQSFEQ